MNNRQKDSVSDYMIKKVGMCWDCAWVSGSVRYRFCERCWRIANKIWDDHCQRKAGATKGT